MNQNKSIKVLIAINILIYVLVGLTSTSFMDFSAPLLISWGGLTNNIYSSYEYWRLFTSMFLHGDIQHLLFNMYCLYMIGTSLSRFISDQHFLLIYFVSGLSSSFASSLLGNYDVSIGASGAIFGVAGFYMMLLMKLKKENQHLDINIFGNIGLFLIVNLAFGFMMPGIDNYAHLGGLIMGVIAFFGLKK